MSIDLEDYKVDRGPDGQKTKRRYIDQFDITVEYYVPTWGDKVEFSMDFGPDTPDADRTAPGKILKYFNRTFKVPDFSDLTADDINDMHGDFIQRLLDLVGNLYTHPDNRTEDVLKDVEVDPKKLNSENGEL